MLEAGRTFGRYEIVAPIGVGGMGAVYRARDTLLRRDVALKVLSSEDGDHDPAEVRARVLREARAAAALRHPNAVSVFDVGEVEGTPFIAMELVSGRSLRTAMRDERVTRETKLRWLVSIADVLAAAHEVGLVHRDVKPENVMIELDGSIKVLDFGIARRADAADGVATESVAPRSGDGPPSFRTAEGTITGTPRYMAPEQKTGGVVDGRTDQYAWGIVACELLCGAHPQKEDLLAIVERARAEGVEPVVLDTIERAMRGRPSDRFASMAEIVDRLAPLTGMSSARSLLSGLGGGAPEPETAGDATERIPSAFSEKTRASTPPAAPRPQWSKLALVVLVLGGVIGAAAVATLLRRAAPSGTSSTDSRAARHRPSPEAHASYLRGRYFWTQRTSTGLTKAVAHYEEAIRIDPQYAEAYVGIAESYLILPYMSAMTDREAEGHVRPALDKALALDPDSASAHCARAYEHLEYHWDFGRSEAEFKRSLELDPDSAVAHQWYAELLDYLARWDEAVAQMKLALEKDPVSVPVLKNYGAVLLHARRYQEAEAILRRTVEMDTKQPYLHLHLAMTLAELQRYDEAIAECRIEGAAAEGPLAKSGELVSELYVAARTGRKDMIAKVYAELEGSELLRVQPFLAGYVYGLAGVPEKMYPALERAIAERARWTLLVNYSPAFDAYRKEPRFQALRKKIGLPD